MENFVKAFTAYARSRGLNRLEFYAEERQQRSLHVYHGALESLETSRLQRVFIEAETEGFTAVCLWKIFPKAFSRSMCGC